MKFRAHEGVSLEYCPGDDRVVVVFGKRLAFARHVKGMSRSALSAKSGISVKVLRMIERANPCRLTEDFVDTLCGWLGIVQGFLEIEPDEYFRADEKYTQICGGGHEFCECGENYAPLLCDAVIAEGKTCDAHLCAKCTTKRSGMDLCSQHRRRARRNRVAS